MGRRVEVGVWVPLGSGEAARPAIFLSHSSKPRQLPGDDRLRYAREVLRLIDEALRDVGFATWIDRERLHPGDGWNAEIHVALHTCAGAVVLLDPVVLADSDWVLAEATVLAHRYATSPDFRLVPVLLGGARPATLQDGTWAPLRLSEIQPARDNPSQLFEDMTHRAQDVAQQVAGAFAGLAPLPANPLLTWWVDEIAAPLRALASTAPHRLDAAAAILHLDWGQDGRRVDRLAHALLDSSRELIPDAVEKLAPLVRGRASPVGDQLADMVTPLWVRLETASGVTRGLRGDPERRRMLISTRDHELASDIINRAAYCSPELRLARSTGEHGENLDRLVASYSDSIRKSLVRFDLGPNASPDAIRKRLARADPPPFALIKAEGLDAEEISGLMDRLHDRFPGVVLVLLSPGPEIARMLPPPPLSVVEPPLTEDELAAATIFRSRILELAGRECPVDQADDYAAAGGAW